MTYVTLDQAGQDQNATRPQHLATAPASGISRCLGVERIGTRSRQARSLIYLREGSGTYILELRHRLGVGVLRKDHDHTRPAPETRLPDHDQDMPQVEPAICRRRGGCIGMYLFRHVLTLLLCVGSGCSLCVVGHHSGWCCTVRAGANWIISYRL